MRSVLVIISGRADYTPIKPVMDALKNKVWLEHLNVEGLIAGACVDEAGNQLDAAPVDLLLVLGDRYEILSSVLAATITKTPIAHIHGGEASFGSFDNQIREAITKLSHIHFVANREFGQRLMQLGEDSERIYVVGAPGLDNLVDLPPREPKKQFVCTYHPATLVDESIEPLLEALDRFTDYEQIWTGVNNDPGSGEIDNALVGRNNVRCDPKDYIAACRQAAAIVGNSSSGIIEAPTLEVPTVNVGRRQEGRLRGPSVLDCEMEVEDICRAIDRALSYDGPFDNLYGPPGASKKIADILASIDLDGILVKQQYRYEGHFGYRFDANGNIVENCTFKWSS